jgi:alkanesulfonate monooxygenase SsuD/methylene tetrahydromethanopterin reductase-like flavin-dependent oxidoreductase (luciferase family)
VTDERRTFGFTLPNRGVMFGLTTPAELLEVGARAEQSGLFDTLWVGDSLFAKPRLDSLALLNALAARTQQVRLGVGCMASFPVRNPIIFAYEWASFDQISGGRSLLVVCTGIVQRGASEREGAPFGVVDRQRARRMNENIAILRKLWSEDNVCFQGDFTSFDDLTLGPKPVQQPCPIWIASNPGGFTQETAVMERPLRRVAEVADGWMTVSLRPKDFTVRWEILRRQAEAIGRDPATIRTCSYHNININPDYDAALEESKRFLDAYYGPVFPIEAVKTWTALGTPEQCIEHLRALRAEGSEHITLRITSWQQREQFERLVSEVLPYVDD